METPAFDPAKFKAVLKHAWSDAAEGWHNGIAKSFGIVSKELLDYASMPQNANVLDLASGDGVSAFEAVRHGATHVTATDLAPTFGPIITAGADALGMGEKVSFQEADIENLPFADNTFDAVHCQFGLMFLPDRMKGLREVYRVLKPGGVFTGAVWCSGEENAMLVTFTKILAEYLPPRSQEAPTLLNCGPAGLLQSEFKQAGFSQTSEKKFPLFFKDRTLDDAWRSWQNNGPFKSAYAQLSGDSRIHIENKIREMLAAFVGPDGVAAPATALFVRGVK